LFVSKED
jgi:hypothetical protein